MGYRGLGSRTATTVKDTTGLNPGNLTTPFTAAVLAVGVPWFEVFHAAVTGVPPGGAATITIGTAPFSYTAPAGGSEWDPAQPPLLQPGEDLYFLWNLAAGGPAPQVRIWLRYDPSAGLA